MQRSKHLGLSVPEFMLALAFVGVSGLSMAPLYYKITNSLRATSYTNDLVATLSYARVQAVMRGQTVSVCSSANGTQCTDTPWERGYIVYVDTGTPGMVRSGEHILRQHLVRDPPVTITLNDSRYVRFTSSGTVIATNVFSVVDDVASVRTTWLDRLSPVSTAHASESASLSSGVFTVCAGDSGRMVRLSLQGFISTSATLCH